MVELVSIEDRRPRGQVDASIVSILEDVLESARSGEFRAVTVVAIRTDGTVHNRVSQSECFHHMLGALTMVQHLMMNAQQDHD